MKKQQTIFITGASSGIGKATALELAKNGHKVFAGIRRKTDKELLESLNENIKGVYIDVTNPASIQKAFWYIVKNSDKIDVLINNAGGVTAGPVELLNVNKLKEQFDLNTFAPIAVAQKFLPLLSNGKIINISSMAATGLFPFISAYCASKRALDILFNAFLVENKDNIKVISVKPAAIKTPIWNKSVEKAKENVENLNKPSVEKYRKELLILEEHALKNNTKGIDVSCVTSRIEKIVNSSNPKCTYNVGFQSHLADFVSKFPQPFINCLIRMKLNMLK